MSSEKVTACKKNGLKNIDAMKTCYLFITLYVISRIVGRYIVSQSKSMPRIDSFIEKCNTTLFNCKAQSIVQNIRVQRSKPNSKFSEIRTEDVGALFFTLKLYGRRLPKCWLFKAEV